MVERRMTEHGYIDDRELDEIERRVAATSPGPWEDFIEARDPIGGCDFIRIGGDDDDQPDMYIEYYVGATAVRVPAADLEFIAHARQDVPRLIAEVRRLRAQLGRGESHR